MNVLRYLLDVAIAIDKRLAAAIGWDGSHTISAQCGSTKNGCRFCSFVCAIANWFEDNHCELWAKKEGLLP